MNNIHCIPVGNGEPMHECHSLCWCHAVKDTKSVNLYIHNAKDCREKWERQGFDMPPQSLWVTVEEKLNDSAWIDPQQRQPEYTGKYLVWTSEGPEILRVEEGFICYADGEPADWDDITAWGVVRKPNA